MKTVTGYHECAEDGQLSHSGSGCIHVELLRKQRAPIPKGYVTVYVGRPELGRGEDGEDGEEPEPQYRCLVPLCYLSYPKFGELLKRAEEEFGFPRQAALCLPCSVAEFQAKLQKIEEDHVNLGPAHQRHHHQTHKHTHRLYPVRKSLSLPTDHRLVHSSFRCVPILSPPLRLTSICHAPCHAPSFFLGRGTQTLVKSKPSPSSTKTKDNV